MMISEKPVLRITIKFILGMLSEFNNKHRILINSCSYVKVGIVERFKYSSTHMNFEITWNLRYETFVITHLAA